jgi:hypothetical protein
LDLTRALKKLSFLAIQRVWSKYNHDQNGLGLKASSRYPIHRERCESEREAVRAAEEAEQKMVRLVSGEQHPNRNQFQQVCEIEIQRVLLLENAP